MSTPVITEETFVLSQKLLGQVFQTADSITLFCGAGVSTSAGIPDFRSPGGLYAQSFKLNGVELRGDQLFDISSLQNSRKLALLNREMTKIRLMSRNATIPKFQEWVARLNTQGRLRRCYTQNFDGIQLRAHRGMANKVYELHGSNQKLRCHTCSAICPAPIEESDYILSTTGLKQCTNCQEIAQKALKSNKRHRPIGYLVPDVLFNQQIQDISFENKGWDIDHDTDVDLFVIAGTTLKTQGTLKLVKAMAENVHHYGGAVIYLDLGEPSKKLLAFVDVYFRMDVNTYSEYVGQVTLEGLPQSSASFRERLTQVAGGLSTINAPVTSSPFIPAPEIAETEHWGRKPLATIKFILLHTSCNRMEADAYSRAVMSGLYHKGYQVELIQQCIGSFNHIHVVQTKGSHTLVAFLTSSILYEDFRPAVQDMEVAEMLYFICQMIDPQTDMLSVNMILFGGYKAFNHLRLAQRLEYEIQGSVVNTLVCGLAVTSSDHLLWANWSVCLAHNWAQEYSTLSTDDKRKTITNSWLEMDGLYQGTNLWVFSNQRQPLLLLSSPWGIRPLGRTLPPITLVCNCTTIPWLTARKHWKVTHDARQGAPASVVTLDIECSACNQSWRLDTSNMIGVMHEHLGSFAVQLNLILQ